MSFGFGVGDFFAVGELTWKVFRACKSAPGEFQELSRELSSLHTILLELQDEAKSPNSLLRRRGSKRKPELDLLIQNISGVLEEIEDLVTRYQSLGRDQKRTWDRVGFATQDLTGLRTQLSFHTNGINLFIASLSASSLARIEGILDDLVKDIKEGRKEPSVVSAAEDDDEAAWSELERELIGDGISRQDVMKYKDNIKEYILILTESRVNGETALHDGPEEARPSTPYGTLYTIPSSDCSTVESSAGDMNPASPNASSEVLATEHISILVPRSNDVDIITPYRRPDLTPNGEAMLARNIPPPLLSDSVDWHGIARSITAASWKSVLQSSKTTRVQPATILYEIHRALHTLKITYTLGRHCVFECTMDIFISRRGAFWDKELYDIIEPEGQSINGYFDTMVFSMKFDIIVERAPVGRAHAIKITRFSSDSYTGHAGLYKCIERRGLEEPEYIIFYLLKRNYSLQSLLFVAKFLIMYVIKNDEPPTFTIPLA